MKGIYMKKLAELYIVKLTNKDYNLKDLFRYVSNEKKKKIESFKYMDYKRSLLKIPWNWIK